MWGGSHFEPFEAGTWGELEVLDLREYLLNFVLFPDLTQGAATINEKNLQVEKDNATLEDKAEIDGEMYVYWIISSQMIMFCLYRF